MPDRHIDHRGQVLTQIARDAIDSAFDRPQNMHANDSAWLQEKGASFVTLKQNEKLRGCIGSLDAYRPLFADVSENAYAAAFRDPRFSTLTEQELSYTQIEVSLLSSMRPIVFAGEQDALAQLQPGLDGVVFEFGRYRSTFLPQVWEQLPDAASFMAHLKNKAGLQPGFWDDEVKLYRYSVTKWQEKDFQEQA